MLVIVLVVILVDAGCGAGYTCWSSGFDAGRSACRAVGCGISQNELISTSSGADYNTAWGASCNAD